MKKTISYIFVSLLLLIAVAFIFFDGKQEQPPLVINNRGDGTEGSPLLKIVAVGDSLTAGFNLPLSDSYPKILEEKLGEAGWEVEVVNAGISGETTAGLLERVDFIINQEPDVLLITIGGNDSFRNLPIENTKENIKKIIRKFKEEIEPENIYLMQIQATANLGLGYRNRFNSIYEDVADEEGVNLLPFVVNEVFLDSDRMLPDGIHPNREGYEFIVDKYIFPELSERMIDDQR